LKILHLGDLHIGKKVNGFSMLEEQRNIFEQIKGIISENNIETVLMAGDIYDKNSPSVEAVTLFDSFLTALVKMNLNVLIISGNHDSVERLSFASSLMETSKVYITKSLTDKLKKVTLTDEYGNINFYLMPFLRPCDVKAIYKDDSIKEYNQAVAKVLSETSVNTDERNIILSHQFITNAETSDSEILSVGGIDNVDAENYSDFDYVALGHIHKPQKITDKIRYSGSILKYSFSEAKINKSVPVIDIKNKGDMKIDLIPLTPLHDMIEITGTYNELMSPEFYNKIDTKSYIHIILTNETAEPDAMNKLRSVYKNIMKVDYSNITTENNCIIDDTKDLDDTKPIEFVKSFFEEMYGKSMNEKQADYLENTIEGLWG